MSIYFTRLYFKDKDKRKIMFSIAFFATSISYILLSLGFEIIEIKYLIWQNLYYWNSFPLMIAILIAVNEYFFSGIDFDRFFKIFLAISALSFMIIFLPFGIGGIFAIANQLITIEIISALFYQIFKQKNLSNLMFLLAISCLAIGGMSMSQNKHLSIFSFFIGYTFLTLVFFVSSAAIDKKDIDSYFALRAKLLSAKDALQKSENKFRNFFENIVNGVAVYDAADDGNDFIIKDFNKAGEQIDNIKREDAVGKSFLEMFPGVNEFGLFEVLQRVWRTGKPEHYPVSLYKDDKIEGWRENYVYKLQSDEIVAVYDDVTKQKQAEIELQNKVKQLKKSKLSTLNIMEDLQETIENLERAENKIMEKNKKLQISTDKLKRMNEEIHVSNEKLKSTQEKLKVLNDKLEQKVIDRTAKIEKLLKQKDGFITQLGHDLKTPLTPIIGLLPILEKRSKDSKSKELLEIIRRSANYMRDLVVKTIQLARLNSSSEQLDIVDTNLLEEANKIIDSNQLIFKENKITVENKIKEDIIVKADKLRLDELFNNLITNAVKYTPKSGNLIIDAKEEEDFVTISFKDTGIGLTKEQIDNIFDEFYKVDPSRHDLGSSGLGLPICKRIAEKHGGKIWAESLGIGKGSTFHFTLKKSSSEQNN